jgi:hypothetical protein
MVTAAEIIQARDKIIAENTLSRSAKQVYDWLKIRSDRWVAEQDLNNMFNDDLLAREPVIELIASGLVCTNFYRGEVREVVTRYGRALLPVRYLRVGLDSRYAYQDDEPYIDMHSFTFVQTGEPVIPPLPSVDERMKKVMARRPIEITKLIEAENIRLLLKGE